MDYGGKAWWTHPTSRKLLVMTFLVLVMFLMELIGGMLSGSLALVSDAFHMLSDAASLFLAILALHVSQRKATPGMSYGYGRAEILGGLLNAVILINVCLFIFIEAIGRLIDPPVIDKPMYVLAIGVVSLIFNLAGLFMFSEHHNHSHGEDTALQAPGNGGGHGGHGSHENMNMRAIFLHILGDAMASCAVIVSGVVVQWTEWSFKYHIDPLVSMIISAYICHATLPLVRQACWVLMQRAPSHCDPGLISSSIQQVHGVRAVSQLHVWQVIKDESVASVHIVLEENAEAAAVVGAVRAIFSKAGIPSCTIEARPRGLVQVTMHGPGVEV